MIGLAATLVNLVLTAALAAVKIVLMVVKGIARIATAPFRR